MLSPLRLISRVGLGPYNIQFKKHTLERKGIPPVLRLSYGRLQVWGDRRADLRCPRTALTLYCFVSQSCCVRLPERANIVAARLLTR